MTETRSYMIIFVQTSDRDKFIAGYAKATAPVVAKYGGKYVMRAPGGMLLEGSEANNFWGDGASVAISEWLDRDAIQAFWDSPEYQEVKKLREGIADVQVIVIDVPKFTKDTS